MTAAAISRDAATASVSPRRRIESIDIVRGIIMILMALDHTRDYFGNAAVNPTDPATTTVWLFFTRWVTHICAPGFFLLTGVGASLTLHRMSKGELSRFLFTRGVWLLFLEIVIVRCFGWQFNFDYRLLLLNVLWGLGFAMIVLSALVHLRDWAVTTIGVAMIATHNLFDGVQAASFGVFTPVGNILHAPGVILETPRHTVFTAYALIPWVGVTAVGYGLGAVYRWETARRNRFLLRLGIALVAGFLLLRTVNGFGDPSPWSQQASPLFTALSYINTTKYPNLGRCRADALSPVSLVRECEAAPQGLVAGLSLR
ncbi:MAG: heparan-alpha-glucosaminide N-acetyltransferase domain-containing protein [Gemmatimonadaceae bacterium]